MTTQQADKAYIAATYARFPVTLVGGKGAELFDADGKRYVDMGSGIGVNIFGTADEQWADVVSAQLKKLAHASNLYYTEPCARLAEKLCLKSGRILQHNHAQRRIPRQNARHSCGDGAGQPA